MGNATNQLHSNEYLDESIISVLTSAIIATKPLSRILD